MTELLCAVLFLVWLGVSTWAIRKLEARRP